VWFLEITGIDYCFKLNLPFSEFIKVFELQLKIIWYDFYKIDVIEELSIDYFYSRDKGMFDSMDEYGFHLDNNGEGAFLLMFGTSEITITLPATIVDSNFCKVIYEMVRDCCSRNSPRNFDS
jgi:hypothetical protein